MSACLNLQIGSPSPISLNGGGGNSALIHPALASHAGKSISPTGPGAGIIDSTELRNIGSMIGLAIKEAQADDGDKFFTPARLFANFFISASQRSKFGINSDKTHAKAKSVVDSIRSHFESLNLVDYYIDILSLGKDDLLELLTFNVSASGLNLLEPSGFSLNKLFSSDPTVAQIVEKINLLLELIVDIYGTHFSYLIEDIAKKIRITSLPMNPKVVLHQWSRVLRAVHLPSPLKTNELIVFLDAHRDTWDCASPLHCQFYKQCCDYNGRFLQASLKTLESNLKLQSSPPLTSKKASGKAQSSFAAKPGSTPVNQKDSRNTISLAGLQGFCYSFLRDGSCPRHSNNRQCSAMNRTTKTLEPLKHGEDFTKLPLPKQEEIRSAFASLPPRVPPQKDKDKV